MDAHSTTCTFSSFPLSAICPKQATLAETIHYKIFDSATLVPWAEWHQYAQSKQFFMQLSYLQGVESAQPDMKFRYVLIYDKKELVGTAYFQIVNFSVSKVKGFIQAEAANGIWGKTKNFFSQRINSLAAYFDVNLLVCGNVFLSGEYAFTHCPNLSAQDAFQLLMKTCEHLYKMERKQQGIRGILVKDFFLTEQHPTNTFQQAGFHPFVVEPIMEMEILPEWKSFKDYQDALSSRYRQRQKSVEKKSSPLTTRELTVAEIEHYTPTMHRFFQSVVSKAGFNMQNPAEDYLLKVKKSLGDKVKITGYFLEDEFVGFMTVVRANEILEAHFLGYEDTTNHTYKIYQRILYDIIRTAIDEKFPTISFGRTAMEIKTTVGATAHPAQLYLKLTNSLFNRLATPVMNRIKTEAWEPRHPFKHQTENTEEHAAK
ncbi:MAG: GNAT family N-acetyltransferase [Bacteroidia bacterium]